ncbi:phosphotransferase-like protein [Variovorax paradoxus]|uniref:phosphotransferase-like protein n=1 Tax=Variovorax paradoxus TaxID=34073 RepID=UPI001ABC6FE9
MIIALYGQSSSGKTTIANALRQILEACPTRHCGEVVKARAKDLGVSFSDLPDAEHRAIDADTRAWTEEQPNRAIVEGRYLHHVLSRTLVGLRLVEVVCDGAAREQRWAMRMKRALAVNELNNMDSADRDFVTKMYPGRSPLSPGLIVDTTSTAAENCAQQILEWVRQK